MADMYSIKLPVPNKLASYTFRNGTSLAQKPISNFTNFAAQSFPLVPERRPRAACLPFCSRNLFHEQLNSVYLYSHLRCFNDPHIISQPKRCTSSFCQVTEINPPAASTIRLVLKLACSSYPPPQHSLHSSPQQLDSASYHGPTLASLISLSLSPEKEKTHLA